MIDRPLLGGGQTALLLLAEHLDPGTFEVAICSGGGGPLVEAARRKGREHIPVDLSRGRGLRPVRELAAILEERKIDILHTHGGYAGLYGRWAARRSRAPVVVHTLHGIHYLHYRNPLSRMVSIWQERILSRLTDTLILVSRSDLGRAKKHKLAPENKMEVILNGLEISGNDEAAASRDRRSKLGWEPGRPVVGTVARLHRQKGVIHLLRAAPEIIKAFPDARIVVVGEGPLGPVLRRRAIRMGFEGRLSFLGERPDALQIMALFDIFVLPSLWEGLPFVLVEAAALGKPIVATAVDGVPEIIEDGKTGLLVRPKDAPALAGAVIRLLGDQTLAAELGEKARALVPPRFPLHRMVEEHQTLYLRLHQMKTSATK
jgi:glycosyltransferase involved in cell wall biosynthesis